MKDKFKYLVIVILFVILIVLMINITRKVPQAQNVNETDIENTVVEEIAEPEEIKVSGYHLVTYAQTANENSFVKTLTVTASNPAKVRFVIGDLDEKSFVKERISFEVECQKGENVFELLDERYLLKEGEYLFMDLFGQDFLYEQENSSVKSLVQTETNKVSGKMPFSESNYILPFKYSLEKAENYKALVIGNDITSKNGSTGMSATDEKHDYYYLTKERLQNVFGNVTISRINATEWEKNNVIGSSRTDWLNKNLPKSTVSNLDLVILQLGDNYNQNDNFEESAKEMVEYIRKYSPNAEIIWIGLWESYPKIQNNLPGICETLEIKFINIRDLNTADYQTVVTEKSENVDENNTEVENTVEVMYPNNEAMQMISNRIIEALKFEF